VPPQGAGVPELEARFGRVTVILGANGTGKSRLLQFIAGNFAGLFGEERLQRRVEGGRAVKIPPHISVNRNTIDTHGTYQRALKQYDRKRGNELASRLTDAFHVLERQGQEEKERHSDAVAAWSRAGKNGDCPEREEPPLDRLARLFNEALPSLRLEFESPNLFVRKGAERYPAHQMSDGEKQALALLADVSMLANRNGVILIDEPELNLNPLLAASVWTAIEADFPKAVFMAGWV
jgi:ABC-type multidrug transport system ATPase subunit